jgi:hypothetical protein
MSSRLSYNGFLANGGWSGVGSTASVGVSWTPCRDTEGQNTAQVFACDQMETPAWNVQTFKGYQNAERAMIQAPGSSTARLLHRAILGAYTTCYPPPDPGSGTCPGSSKDWGYWLGYPLGNRYSAGSYYRQNFQNGHIRFYPSSSTVEVWFADILTISYQFADHPP